MELTTKERRLHLTMLVLIFSTPLINIVKNIMFILVALQFKEDQPVITGVLLTYVAITITYHVYKNLITLKKRNQNKVEKPSTSEQLNLLRETYKNDVRTLQIETKKFFEEKHQRAVFLAKEMLDKFKPTVINFSLELSSLIILIILYFRMK